jgi:FkbM family methyltransferase
MAKLISGGLRALARARHSRLARARAADVSAILQDDAIALLDVGASGGIIPRWSPYRQSIAFTGIEPDERSVPGLISSPDSRIFRSYEIIPSGVWNASGTVGISFTRKPMCSSHFSPNGPFLSRFPAVDRFDIVGSGQIKCETVDALFAVAARRIDFIKLDLEGGELAVLEGAVHTLQTCLGLHVEVSFQSIRERQPLFGDVARFLESCGMEFIDFVALLRWERDSFNGPGQAIFADALFLRSPENLMAVDQARFLTARTARAYLAILTIYDRYDLALKFLGLLETNNSVLEANAIGRLATIIRKRRARFDSHRRVAAAFSRFFSHYAGQDSSLHQLY